MLKPFSLFMFLFIGYIPTYGSTFETTELVKTEFLNYNGLHNLSQDFLEVIRTPPEEFIKLNIDNQSDHRYEASGIYKLIPYYQRIFPADGKTSRFIIQKHPMSGEWLLTEIYASIWHKTIFSFPKENENPLRDAIVVKAFSVFQEEVQEIKKTNLNYKEEIDLKNKRIKLLKQEHEKTIENIKEKFEQELSEKNKQCIKLKIPYEKLKSSIKQTFKEKERLNEKKNVDEKQEIKKTFQIKLEELEKQSQAQIEELEKKLFEKENEINNFKTQLTIFEKLNENLKLENNGFKYNENILEEKIKTCLSSYENVKKEFKQTKILLKEFEQKSIQVKKNLKKIDSIKNKLSIPEISYQIKSETFDLINTENKEKIKMEFEKKLIEQKNENNKLLITLHEMKHQIAQCEAQSKEHQLRHEDLKSIIKTNDKFFKILKNQLQEEQEKSKIASKKLLEIEKIIQEKENQIQEKAIQMQEKENQVHYLQTQLEELDNKRCQECFLSECHCDENVEEEIFELLEGKNEVEALPNAGTDNNILSSEKQEYKKILPDKEFDKKEDLHMAQEAILTMRTLEKENQMLAAWLEQAATKTIKQRETLVGCQNLNEILISENENLKLKNEKFQKSILNMRNLNNKFVKQTIEEKHKLKTCETELIDRENQIHEKENQIYNLKTQFVKRIEKVENKIKQKGFVVKRHHDCDHKFKDEEQSLRATISTESTINLEEEVDSKELEEITDISDTDDMLKEANDILKQMEFLHEDMLVETDILVNKIEDDITNNFETKLPKLEEKNKLQEIQTSSSTKVDVIASTSTQNSPKIIQNQISEEEGIYQKVKENTSLMKEYDVLMKHMNIEYEELVNTFFKNVDGFKDMELSIQFSQYFTEEKNLGWMDPIYQYQFLFVHYGAICYAEEHTNFIDKKFQFLDKIGVSCENGETNIKNWWKETGQDMYIWILHKIKMKHNTLLQNTLKSLENEKTRVLFTLFQKSPKLFDAPQYKYESLLKEIGYLRYGGLYTLNYFKCMKQFLQ